MVCSQLHFQTRLAPFILTEIVKTCTPSKYGTLIKRPWEFKGSIFRARRKAEKLSGQNLCALFFPTARKCKTERDSVFNAFLLALSLAALFYALELRRLARRKSREKMRHENRKTEESPFSCITRLFPRKPVEEA